MKEQFDKQSFLEHYTGKNRFVECFQVTFVKLQMSSWISHYWWFDPLHQLAEWVEDFTFLATPLPEFASTYHYRNFALCAYKYIWLCQGTTDCHILSDCNWTRTQSHLVLKWTLNHLAKLTVAKWFSLAKWLSVRLRTKWFWVRFQLQSLHLQISRLFRAKSSLTFWQL